MIPLIVVTPALSLNKRSYVGAVDAFQGAEALVVASQIAGSAAVSVHPNRAHCWMGSPVLGREATHLQSWISSVVVQWPQRRCWACRWFPKMVPLGSSGSW